MPYINMKILVLVGVVLLCMCIFRPYNKIDRYIIGFTGLGLLIVSIVLS